MKFPASTRQAAVQQQLSAQYDDTVASIDRQIAAQNKINEVYAQSGGNIAEITAKTQAETAARDTAIPGTEAYASQVALLTDKNLQLAQSQKALAQIQANKQVEDNIDYIKAETTALGENEDQRNRDLAVLRAEQSQHEKYGPVLTGEQQRYVDLVGAQADYTSQLQHQQQVLGDVTGAFSGIADTISNDVTQAFVEGSGAGVTFTSVLQGIETQVASLIVKFAVINPLLNELFGGQNRTTLSDVGGLLGGLLGNSTTSTTSASASSGLLGTGFNGAGIALGSTASSTSSSGLGLSDVAGYAGSLGTLSKGVDYLTGGHLVSDLSSGLKDAFSRAANYSLYSSTPTALQTVPEGAADDVASAGGSLSGGSTGGVNITASSALGIVGGLYGAYSGFERGGVGGTVEGVGGIASAGLAVAGTGLLGTGAAGLAAAAGPYAPIALAAIAVIGALLPGGHPANPYQDTEVDAQGGQLVAGKTVSQIESTTAAVQSVNDYSASLNQFMASAGLKLTNLDGVVGHIGDNITGLEQVSSPDALFSKLQFGDDPSDTSNFGVAKGALAGMSFQTFGDLGAELQKIAAFSDAASAIGLKLQSVSTDLTNIQIASVEQNATAATTTVQDAQGNNVTFDSDLRQALQNDLPGKTFASVQALDDEIGSVTNFITQTLPQLLTPTVQTTSSTSTARAAVDAQYEAGIGQDQALGLGNTAALTTAWQQAIALVMKPAVAAWTTTLTSIAGRSETLLNGQSGAGDATLNNLAQTQAAERQSFEDQARQTWGDAAVSTANYQAELQQLIETQNAETLATQQQVQAAKDQSASTLFSLEAQNAQAAGVDSSAAQMQALIAQQAQAGDQFVADWVSYYGQASLSSAAFQQQQQIMDEANYKARLDLQNSFNGQSAAQLQQAQGSVTTLLTSIHDYAVKLQTGSSSPLSPLDQYDLAKSQFNAVSGAAAAGDATSASELTTYADALISTSQAVNGSGAAYAADVNQVLDALQNVASNTDALTQGFMTQQFQQLTDATNTVTAAVNNVQSEIAALRKEMQAQTRALAA